MDSFLDGLCVGSLLATALLLAPSLLILVTCFRNAGEIDGKGNIVE